VCGVCVCVWCVCGVCVCGVCVCGVCVCVCVCVTGNMERHFSYSDTDKVAFQNSLKFKS